GWLGWANGFHNRDRAAAWAIHTDRTLERAAGGVAKWRQESGSAPDARVFTTHPDLGHYLAWFAPGEKCFLDSRLQLFTKVADDNAALSRAMGLLPDGDADRSRLGELLQSHGIAAVLLYDADYGRMSRALREVNAAEPRYWEPLRVDGGAVLCMPMGSPLA